MKEIRYNRSLFWIALLTAAATFPLIFMGGLVTSKQAGMSVPDWPNSYGYNMFLFPPNKWVGGIFYEHTHRLMGTLVGFLAVMLATLANGPGSSPKGRRRIVGIVVIVSLLNIVGTAVMVAQPDWFNLSASARGVAKIVPQGLVTEVGILLCGAIAFFARRPDPRRWVRILALICLAAVCLQGLLGGLRVDLVNLTLAIIHGCFAQAFFCFAAFMALVTSRWWLAAPALTSSAQGRRLVTVGVIAVAVIYLQLIAGAVMRHYQAGLAVTDFPLIYGRYLPPTSGQELQKINSRRAWSALSTDAARPADPAVAQQLSRPVTLDQIWIHAIHRYGAVCVTIAALALAGYALRRRRDGVGLAVPAVLLIVLLATQVTLGSLVVLLRKPADVTSLHVAVGALTLMTAFILTARAWRLFGSPFSATQGEAVRPDRIGDRGLSLKESPAL